MQKNVWSKSKIMYEIDLDDFCKTGIWKVYDAIGHLEASKVGYFAY